jgi:DnaJ-class molecular chaperone
MQSLAILEEHAVITICRLLLLGLRLSHCDQVDSPDLYTVLGVARDASEHDIKKAYRQLAMRWHPDKQPARNREEAERKFKSIAHAYEVLSKHAMRADYDQLGREWDSSRADHSGYAASFRHKFKDADQVFKEFFGSEDPFADFFADPTATTPARDELLRRHWAGKPAAQNAPQNEWLQRMKAKVGGGSKPGSRDLR